MRCSAWIMDPNGEDARPCLAENCQEHRLPPSIKPLPPHPTGHTPGPHHKETVR